MSLPNIFKIPGADSWLDSSVGSSSNVRRPGPLSRRFGLRLNTVASLLLWRRILLLAGCLTPALSADRVVHSDVLDLKTNWGRRITFKTCQRFAHLHGLHQLQNEYSVYLKHSKDSEPKTLLFSKNVWKYEANYEIGQMDLRTRCFTNKQLHNHF